MGRDLAQLRDRFDAFLAWRQKIGDDVAALALFEESNAFLAVLCGADGVSESR